MCVCMYVRMNERMNECYSVVSVPGDPLRSDAACHLVAVRGTPTR